MHSNHFHRFSLVAIMLTVACSVLLSSCFHRQRQLGVTGPQRSHLEKLLDSMSFTTHHHYGMGYNFVVKADSMVLIKQMPEEIVSHLQFDTMCVMKHRRVVVADIHIVPNDKNDSVWVELGTEESRFGWIHEHTLLHQTVPDDPISWFISAFSDTHLIVFLIVLLCIGGAYTVRHQLKYKSHIVHFNDIDSFYPTLLALIVALSATLYATIQNFFPVPGSSFTSTRRLTRLRRNTSWHCSSPWCGPCSWLRWQPSTTCASSCPPARLWFTCWACLPFAP